MAKAYSVARLARDADKLKARIRAKAWYLANRIRANATCKANREANLEAAAVRRKAWIAANKEKHRQSKIASVHRRRAKKAGAEGSHTAADIRLLFDRQKRRCVSCRCSIADGYHIDHIMPIVRGGSNWPANLQLLCGPCNHRKGSKEPLKWAHENGLLL